jgi:hypothetical protein
MGDNSIPPLGTKLRFSTLEYDLVRLRSLDDRRFAEMTVRKCEGLPTNESLRRYSNRNLFHRGGPFLGVNPRSFNRILFAVAKRS